ncbi:MAG: Maf family protein [Faecalibacterium sp.]
MTRPLILASASPRRRELLSLYTTDFTVSVSDFEESGVQAATPAQLVEKLARGKCLSVAARHPGCVVLGCDTVVDVNGEVFGKPQDAADAARMLRALSGSTHQVHTGVCVSDSVRTKSFVDSCNVTFFPISEQEIARYAATKEPYDKAGAYGIQGRAALWLDHLEGDYYTIMGLPVSRTARLLEQF